MKNISETAKRNHEEMFPGAKSVVGKTDPELVELFTNFAYDDVIAHNLLSPKHRVMMILASTIGSAALAEYKVMMSAALNVGVTPAEIKEVLYQSVPYVGFSRAFDFIHATNDFFVAQEISLPLEAAGTTDPATRMEKGLAAQKEIFGAGIDKNYEQSPKDLLHIQKFLSANCFGDYYTRRGLDLKTREMVTLSILIAMGGTDPQIKGHVHGNLKMGTGRAELISLITQLLPWVGYPRSLNAIAAVNEIAPAEDPRK